MASSYTDLGTELMTTGENAGNWGTKTNVNLQILEEAVRGYVAISANSDQTLSLTDGSTGDSIRNAVIAFTGTLSANRTITVPAVEKWWIMDNQTAGAYTLTVKVSGQTGVTWGASDKGTKILYANGTDVVDTNVGGGVGGYDLNGNELILDADADTSITADTDDQIDIKIAGADDFQFTANTFTAQSGSTIAAQALTATTVTASGIVKTDDTTEATSTTDGSLQTDGGLSVAKDAVIGDDLKLLSDSAVLSFGADSDTTLTHTDGTGLTLNSTNKLTFGDTGTYIHQSADGVLDLVSDTEIEINATTIDINGAVAMDGAITGATNITLSGELDAATLDISGNADIDGTTNLDAVDIDGAVQLDSTFTVGVDDTGYDVKFFGASAGAYGLYDESADAFEVRGATAAGAGLLKLTTGELTVVDADKLGRIDFQAPLESDGTDAVAIAASIWAEADDTFSASVNNTDLVFALGKSEAATEKFRFTADGEIGLGGANYGTDGQVLTSGGAGAAAAWETISTAAVTALNNATANEIVTVGATTTELDAEGNFTYDGNNAALTSSVSTNPIISITNTNTDANGSILRFIKDAGEAGAANDISGLISFYADDAGQNNQEFGRITGRVVDATAGGEEGALDFYVAEYDGTVTKGMEIKGLSSDGNITVDISTHDGSAGGLMLASTLVTATATELNLMDGGTAAGTTAVASGDGVVTNDGGTMRQTTVATFDTYFSGSTQTLTNKTLTAPKFADAGYIADANGNELVILQTTASAVNQFDIHNAATGNNPVIEATGGDSNVGLDFTTKGTGAIKFNDLAYFPQQAITSTSNAVAWDAQAKPNAYHLTTENTTLSAPSNAVEGAFICIEVNFNGSHTFSWNAVFNFAADTAPTTTDTDAKTDIFVFRYNGSIWQEVGRTLNIPES